MSVNVSEFSWVNLDMEYLPPFQELLYFGRVASQENVSTVSVTSPFGAKVSFPSPMSIVVVETYSSYPAFWYSQLTYPHSYHVCSVGVFLIHSQGEYDSEKDYCLRYSGGLMVFYYSSLLKSRFH